MSAKHDLQHSIISTLKNNRDGSFSTQAARKKRLLLAAEQINKGGYKIAHIKQMKLKHVQFLVEKWKFEGLTAGTIKNRMTDLRWAMGKYGNADLIPAKNDDLHIPHRKYVTNKDKSVVLSNDDINKISDTDVKMSLILQRAFGLRREESIKIRLNEAVVGDELRLNGNWCKNGRERTVKIQYPEQRVAIEQVKAHLGGRNRSLIPEARTYVQQLCIYERQTSRAGFHKLHGMRHGYAHKRYFDLTGWQCHAKGGVPSSQLNVEQKKLDQLARLQISEELGHSRPDVVAIYCAS